MIDLDRFKEINDSFGHSVGDDLLRLVELRHPPRGRPAGGGHRAQHTVQLGQELGTTIVAEGIEDGGTLATLQRWGCDVAQGYHIARPMPAGVFLDWLAVHPIPAPADRLPG